jgi:hypothetical protein
MNAVQLVSGRCQPYICIYESVIGAPAARRLHRVVLASPFACAPRTAKWCSELPHTPEGIVVVLISPCGVDEDDAMILEQPPAGTVAFFQQ